MRRSWCAITIGLVLSGGSSLALGQSRYEVPPVLQAAVVMPPELLKSPVYTVDDQVTTDGLVTRTMLRSSHGDFVAEGPGMVVVRAAEIQALDVLAKTETTEIFQKALQASLKPVSR